MENIRELFKIPNTPENIIKRIFVIQEYKETHDIKSEIGINICDVIKWAENKNE
jgi:hypothetical protein